MGRTKLKQARHVSPAPRAAPKPATPSVWGGHAVAAAFLLVLVVAAYSPCLDNGFVNWDDDENFLENLSFRGLGWPQIRWAWTTLHVGVYQPLAWMILEAQYV